MKKLILTTLAVAALALCLPSPQRQVAHASSGFTDPDLCYDFESTGNQSATVGSVTLTDNNTVQVHASGRGGGGNALLLNGTDEHLSSTTNATLEVSDQDFTWAVWVYLTSTSGNRPIFVKDTSLYQYYAYYYNVAAADQLTWRTAFFDSELETGAITVNTWTLVIGRHQAGATDLNGLSVNGAAFTTTAATNATGAESNDFFVGRNGAEYFEGRMDTLTFWKGYALSDANASTLYASGTGMDCADITGGGGGGGVTPRGTLLGILP
jgi:hypothetical protein